jgi:hypothetical protein
MEHTEQPMTRTIDVTGLPEEAIHAVESLVSVLRGRAESPDKRVPFSSREEWVKAIRAWAGNHCPQATAADWSRESIYAGRGE